MGLLPGVRTGPVLWSKGLVHFLQCLHKILLTARRFSYFHPEKNITSAIERYANEIKRVTGVIDAHLAKTGQQWLVGNKCTYADLAFVPWQMNVPMLLGEDGAKLEQDYPNYSAWNKRLLERESVKKIAEDKAKAMSQSGH